MIDKSQAEKIKNWDQNAPWKINTIEMNKSKFYLNLKSKEEEQEDKSSRITT